MKTFLTALFLLSQSADAIALEHAPTPATDEAATVFAGMDRDRNGELSLQEFTKGVARPFGAREQGVVYQRLPARFRMFDADGSGFLEAAEFAAFAQHWRSEGDAPALADADRNGDGRIDFREFAAIHVARSASSDANVPDDGISPSPPRGAGRMHPPQHLRNATIRRTT
jgi:Ca2+-binding EF-hand superfamily protein